MKNVMAIVAAACIGIGIGFFVGTNQHQAAQPQMNAGPMGQSGEPSGMPGSGNSGKQNGNQPISGQISSHDEKTLTVKLRDGGSKIVYLSTDTKISKSVSATTSDLTNGENVMVIGTAGTDGNVTAQNITLGANIPPEMGTKQNSTPPANQK